MAAKLAFQYDREADILHISNRPPYAEQETEELGDDVIARVNPKTGDVESLEVLFFSTRLLRSDMFELPVTAAMDPAQWPTDSTKRPKPATIATNPASRALRAAHTRPRMRMSAGIAIPSAQPAHGLGECWA